ncbi:hypothetical protein HNY73_006475 [Argiope bruennichi]|uniref:Uncharacterized protein n=1 Tax=Argiope bruennichi TaxID=94029 RepID=A0A8T0FK78_ARGBR|nr:hypothetical protein HNY73_006475 [Argiope bruennichi]
MKLKVLLEFMISMEGFVLFEDVASNRCSYCCQNKVTITKGRFIESFPIGYLRDPFLGAEYQIGPIHICISCKEVLTRHPLPGVVSSIATTEKGVKKAGVDCMGEDLAG